MAWPDVACREKAIRFVCLWLILQEQGPLALSCY